MGIQTSFSKLDNTSLSAAPGEISSSLGERLDRFSPEPGAAPRVTDKWLLSSALQKLIRRGQRHRAVAVALQLHRIDPRYLPRRLPIIAIEDVGLGDLTVCQEVLLLCSSSRWWQQESERTIAFIVDAMASSVKSRVICDAMCWAEVHPGTSTMLDAYLKSGRAQLVEIAADRQRSRLERSNALRVLGGITRRIGNRYEALSKCDLAGLDAVADLLHLPPLARSLLAQHRKSGNLAAMLPIAIEAAVERTVTAGSDFPRSLDNIEGIPLCAIDMFSEVGRAALRDYFMSSTALRAFAGQHIRRSNPIRLMNMAVFHAEAALLDRYLTSPPLDAIREETEQEEMRHLGMTDPNARTELRAILLAEAPILATTRVNHIRHHLQRRSDAQRSGAALG